MELLNDLDCRKVKIDDAIKLLIEAKKNGDSTLELYHDSVGYEQCVRVETKKEYRPPGGIDT